MLERRDECTEFFIEVAAFRKSWANQGLNDEELRNLQAAILDNPKTGAVIEGTGGLRKLRWNRPPVGKRGGIRVIYVDFETYRVTYLVYVYSKTEKDDLSEDDKAAYRKIIHEIEGDLKAKSRRK